MINEGNISFVEGKDLGNGKTLYAVIQLVNKRLYEKENIACNFELKGLKYNRIYSEDELFNITDSFIVIDEIDKSINCDDMTSGQLFYDKMIKHLRKNESEIMFITQQIDMIQPRVRRMTKELIIPKITNQFKEPKAIKYNNKIYTSKVHPHNSRLAVTIFEYNESLVRSKNYDNLIVKDIKSYKNLYYYFQFYNTLEKFDEPLKQTSITVRKRKKKVIQDD